MKKIKAEVFLLNDLKKLFRFLRYRLSFILVIADNHYFFKFLLFVNFSFFLSLEKLLLKSPSLRLSRPFALVLELAHVLFPVESFYLFVLELLEFRGTMERAKATIFKSFLF